MMKKIGIGLGVLIVAIGVAVFVLVGNLGKIVKGGIEGVGSELMGVPVQVTSVDLKLKDGSGQISGMSIGNPAGYSSANVFQMDVIRLGLSLKSLGGQPIVINDFTIASPVVNLEVKENGSSNLQAIMDNMEKNSAKADEKAAAEQPKAEGAPEDEPVRVAFKKLSITGVTVNVKKEGPEPQNETVVIPDIILSDVGGAKGLTPAEIGSVIFGEIIASSMKNALEQKLTEEIEKAAGGLMDSLKKKLGADKDK
ncbi:MAG: hypothetical protein GY702_04565 [Desulfobulbaceae bacterium]|nr:hypothetical protein [Desulfobulbaceae bacterium]